MAEIRVWAGHKTQRVCRCARACVRVHECVCTRVCTVYDLCTCVCA